MGREAKAREMRSNALRAFVQSFAIISRSMAVTLIVTDQDPELDEEGRPQGRTRQFTTTLCDPMSGLNHMSHGAEILYSSFEKASQEVQEHVAELARKSAEKMPMPGEDEPPGEPPSGEGEGAPS
jgi:hypothetical protein